MDLELKNKVGIVTGASRGIGAEIARELGREGCALILAARSSQDLTDRVAELKNAGTRALAVPTDLRQPSAATDLVAAAVTEFGHIDFVVANAGAAKMGDFLELTEDDWQQGFGLKFFGHMRLMRAAWPQLKASSGSIVIIAGIAARTPGPTGVITGSINAALGNLTKSLAARGVSEGVRVNMINPAMIRTTRLAGRVRQMAQILGSSDDEAERHMVKQNQVTRVGEPEDIAGLVSFILSRRGSYLNGALIDMDGGKTKTM